MSARILDCTIEQYRADPCARPSLNFSTAKTLLDRSPAHAWLEHPRFGNVGRESSASQNNGSLIHRLLLGQGETIAIIHAGDFRTKAAQTARDDAIAAGELPILAHKFSQAEFAADQIRKHLREFGIVLSGESEVAIEWEEESDLGPVLCRCRLDHRLERATLDIKTCESAHPTAVTRAMLNYRYPLQQFAYQRATAALDGRPDDFLFAFVECEAPYAVLPARLDGPFTEIGALQWRRAVNLWARCLKDNDWPGYTREAVLLSAPDWTIAQELGTYDG